MLPFWVPAFSSFLAFSFAFVHFGFVVLFLVRSLLVASNGYWLLTNYTVAILLHFINCVCAGRTFHIVSIAMSSSSELLISLTDVMLYLWPVNYAFRLGSDSSTRRLSRIDDPGLHWELNYITHGPFLEEDISTFDMVEFLSDVDSLNLLLPDSVGRHGCGICCVSHKRLSSFFAGRQTGPEPSYELCLFQASLIYGAPTM